MKKPEINPADSHHYFSENCFNQTWDLIDIPDKTDDQNEEMLLLAMTSCYHWSQRKDSTPEKMSIAYWLISRVYALLNQARNARHFAQRSLVLAEQGNLSAFYLGYAYESLARSELLSKNMDQSREYLEKAKIYAAQVPDENDRKLLVDDLATIHPH